MSLKNLFLLNIMDNQIKKAVEFLCDITRAKAGYICAIRNKKPIVLMQTNEFNEITQLVEDFNRNLVELDDIENLSAEISLSFKKIKDSLNLKFSTIDLLNVTKPFDKLFLLLFSEQEIKRDNEFYSIIESFQRYFVYDYIEKFESQNSKFNFSIFNKFSSAVFITDKKRTILYSNEKSDKIFEIKEKNKPNISDFGFLGTPDNEVKYIVSSNGNRIFKIHSTSIYNSQKKKNDIIYIYMEITNDIFFNKQSDKAIENSGLVIYWLDINSLEIYFIIGAVKDFFGYTQKELLNKKIPVFDEIEKYNISNFDNFLKEIKEGKHSEIEYKLKDSNGNERYIHHKVVPVRENGIVVKAVGIVSDVSKFKIIEKKLKLLKDKFRLLTETSNDLIFTLDAFGYFVTVNKSGAKALGYTVEEMKKRHFLEFLNTESKSNVAIAFQKILTSRNVVKFETTLINKFKEEVVFEFFACSTQKNEEITGMMAIGKNITYRRQDESKLIDLNNKLIEANRLITIEKDRAKQQISILEELNILKNEFISNVSHELRTPLASIVGFAETIASDPELPKDMIAEFNNIIYSEGKRLAKLINDILDFSKLESEKEPLEKSKFDVLKLLRQLVENFKTQAKAKKIILTSKIPEAEVIIFADKERINSAISNVISNAIKFTKKEGRVTIIAQDFLKEIEIIISDTGIGIPKSEMPKLFQKFSKVNTPGTQLPGAGLGLSRTKTIIDLHNGLINIQSEVNKGTTVVIRLPKKLKT